ncbi:glycosyltransferase family 2 protein [Mucisphaera sp.]|uniref:glycosyltransferase family 2 protein n=1 Tax=Mucisphaera sp. TaxID=2913024 RepID=UPI003D109277
MHDSVSVFITSYNHRDYLIEAVDSVLAQTRPVDQIVIVDDASSDGSQELIRSYAIRYPGRIDYAFHATNRGVSATKSHAASLCTGHWMTYLDGDDRMLPARIENEIAVAISLPKQAILFSNFQTIDPSGNILNRWAAGDDVPTGNVLPVLLARAFPRGMVFRNELLPRHLFHEVAGYDANINLYEDWELRIRLAAAGAAFHYCPELGSEYRLHPGGVSRQDPRKHLAAVTHIRRKHQDLIDRLEAADRLAATRCFDQLEQIFASRAAHRSLRSLDLKNAVSYGLKALYRRAA